MDTAPLDDEYGRRTWRHTNFFLWISEELFQIRGPQPDYAHEILEGGMKNIGTDAGDHFHSCMKIDDLLHSIGPYGLMQRYVSPLQVIRAMADPQWESTTPATSPTAPTNNDHQPGEGQVEIMATKCAQNNDLEQAGRELLTIIAMGKTCSDPYFRFAILEMEEHCKKDKINMLSDET
eukprot:8753224-Heterocapsa_arctica.AAC.1